MPNTFTLIASSTVGSGGAANIEFTSIPATYTDLSVSLSVRSSTTAELYAQVNNSTSTIYRNRSIQGTGSSVSAATYQTAKYFLGEANWNTFTANTFSSQSLYLPDYAGSKNKSLLVDSVTENNATLAYMYLIGGLWSNTDAITSIKFTISSGTFDQYSTAYLYGIKKN
jgi:hypothetical protein